MQNSPSDFWVGLLVLMLLAAGLTVWVGIFRRRRAGMPLVAFEPRRPVPWTIVATSLIFVGYFFLQVGTAHVAFNLAGIDAKPQVEQAEEPKEKQIDPRRYSAMLTANAIANTLTAVLATVFLILSTGATWSDLGFRPLCPRRDLALGMATFAAVVIPVYGIQAILTQFTEDRHPIVEMLAKHMNTGLLAVSALAAVAVAPLVEEFLFRVVLQGWLERLETQAAAKSKDPIEAALEQDSATHADPSPAVVDEASDDVYNAYRPPTYAIEAPTVGEGVWWRPIVVSAAIFAMMHIGNGPDPIPLFVLALVLGYLYQRTHRIWPSFIVHFCLNASSLLVLWAQSGNKK